MRSAPVTAIREVMNRILLTGATGVVGRRVLPLLVSAGHSVTAVGRAPEQQELLRAVGASPSR
jgi:uncharacterized protein YbjT (DUF2867 family)